MKFLGAGAPQRCWCRTAGAARTSVLARAKPVKFAKYQGLGNDFILIDNRDSPEPCITPEQAAKMCDRNFGIGGDGVIFALPAVGDHDYTMRIYNSDGSEPEMCGNGIRCLARFVADLDGTAVGSQRVHTLAGTMVPCLTDTGEVTVDMGEPILTPSQVPCTLDANHESGAAVAVPVECEGSTWSVTAVSMGNPHCLIYEQDGKPIADVDALDLDRYGPPFESNAIFPARTNTEFVEVVSRSHVKMRVWERGAGPTLACGTGACATLVAGVLEGRLDRTCQVDLPGGPLHITWNEGDNHILMTGPAELVFEGSMSV
ncbi:unnamed protein product [Pedinophyceae sp. YPF-701]|nr:unnamed protein product [Pedinophyceae sp. YPF-701]